MLLATALTASFAVIAPSLSVLQCLSQLVRIVRVGAQGVSLTTWILSAFVAEIWAGYGLIFHVPAEIYANLPFWAVASYVVVAVARSQGSTRRATILYVATVGLAVLATLAGLTPAGRAALATLADASAVVIYLPQLAVTLRTSDLTGVSVLSWALALVTSLAWALYGALIHQPPVALPSIVMVPSALAILVKAARHRVRARALAGALAPIVE